MLCTQHVAKPLTLRSCSCKHCKYHRPSLPQRVLAVGYSVLHPAFYNNCDLLLLTQLHTLQVPSPSSVPQGGSSKLQCLVPSCRSHILCCSRSCTHCRYYHPSPPHRAVKTERTFEGISLDTPGQSSRQVLQMSRFQLCAACHQRESNPGSGAFLPVESALLSMKSFAPREQHVLPQHLLHFDCVILHLVCAAYVCGRAMPTRVQHIFL